RARRDRRTDATERYGGCTSIARGICRASAQLERREDSRVRRDRALPLARRAALGRRAVLPRCGCMGSTRSGGATRTSTACSPRRAESSWRNRNMSTSVTRPERLELEDASTADLVREAIDEAKELVRIEIELAKNEVEREIARAKRAAIGLAIAL